ncbi:quinon protein alcohol dehydrogenase-like superfamily [Ochromonadaceae sp. CCMP2298]|nr:quinon protein alcohol dehydrogenase-like superfamily [Ochromonadaceae sp. CCMP2298]
MSGKLVVRQAFGINPNVKNCLTFSQEHHLAYLCGHQIAVINTESKDQSFITGTASYQHQSLGITSMVVSLAKKTIAVAEKVEPTAIITLYDSHTLRKKRMLTYGDLGSSEVRCMAFSEDGRYMLVQGAGPDWNLVLWSIEKAHKVLTSVRVSQSDETPVHQVSFCPWDSAVVLVIGRGILRLFRHSEGQLRQIALIVRRESANFISHVWLPEDNLLIGTDTGEIMFIENFEFRGYIAASHVGAEEELQPVLCMAPYARGFVVGTSFGRLKLYERQEDLKEKYSMEDSCILPGERPGHVLAFAVGPDDSLVCATDRQQLLGLSLSNLLGIKEGTSGVENILTSFHGPGVSGEAAITGIDTALWKNIIVTTGRDCTVRVWNAVDKKMELMREFEEEPIGLSVHPSGMYIAVAFAERIQILSLLLEEIHLVREITARQCSGVKFSRGGQLLAAMNGSNLQLYNAHTGVPCGTLRGHNNKIRSVVWMPCDSKIVTIGAEGMVYFWDLFPVSRRYAIFYIVVFVITIILCYCYLLFLYVIFICYCYDKLLIPHPPTHISSFPPPSTHTFPTPYPSTRRPEHYPGAVGITAGAGLTDGTKIFVATQDKMLKELEFSSHGPISSLGMY